LILTIKVFLPYINQGDRIRLQTKKGVVSITKDNWLKDVRKGCAKCNFLKRLETVFELVLYNVTEMMLSSKKKITYFFFAVYLGGGGVTVSQNFFFFFEIGQSHSLKTSVLEFFIKFGS